MKEVRARRRFPPSSAQFRLVWRAILNEFEPLCQMEVEPIHLHREFPVPDLPEGEELATVVKEEPCEIPGRRCVEPGLRMHHFRRGPFAPVGKGFFSTRSTSKGISEAARMLSDKVSRPEEKESPAG